MSELVSRFVRRLPDGEVYRERLGLELSLIEQHRLTALFVQVQEIIQLIPDIPHNIRGSAGSSLVCYLLGITHIDPVRWRLRLSRFLHELRTDMPDIDIDVPYNRRDEVWRRVFGRYADRAARVSNRVMWRDASIYQEAVRRFGVDLSEAQHEEVRGELQGKQRTWAKHCGGLVIMPSTVPDEELIASFQLAWDKHDVETRGHYKIDILSSRGLAQLVDLSDRPLFDYPDEDSLTEALWARGDSLGVTGGESPAFQKAAAGLDAKNRHDIILASALIRPAAAAGTKKVAFFDKWRTHREQSALVYDDDCIAAISKTLGVSEAKADLLRRDITKRRIKPPPELAEVGEFTQYSFCKSHSVAYGAVVWALSYHKARDPRAFWRAALAHCQPMYRRWVHIREAVRSGVEVERQLSLFPPSPEQSYMSKGWWGQRQDLPGLYEDKRGDLIHARGLIGTHRIVRVKKREEGPEHITFVTLWTGERYVQAVLGGEVDLREADILDVYGREKEVQRSRYLDVTRHEAVAL